MENSRMIGLLILGFFAVYLLASIWMTKKAACWAKTNNKRPWLWGGLAAFMMYNLVFWDLIPTLVMHKYYCATQAGFWVYKTPEQWKVESPELTKEDLKPYVEGEKGQHLVLHSSSSFPISVTKINRRVYQALEVKKPTWWIFFPVGKRVEYVKDIATDQTLAELISFRSGYGNPMTRGELRDFKTWLANSGCSSGEKTSFFLSGNQSNKARIKFESYINSLIKLGEKDV